MVYLRPIILNWKVETLTEGSLQAYCYYFLKNTELLNQLTLNSEGDEDILACKGYRGEVASGEELIGILQKKPIKGIHFTTNIYRLLGISLLNFELLNALIESKFQDSSIKYKYLISKVYPIYGQKLNNYLKTCENISDNYFLTLLKHLYSNDFESLEVAELLYLFTDVNDPDIIDLLLLEDIEKALFKVKYQNIEPKDLVYKILNNFSNAIKAITTNRRKDHQPFMFKDEYDVQDILYVILKSIFPELKPEEPTPQVGGSYNRIDFCLPKEGIVLEIKMIKEKDNNEKEFIKQLKEDIQSYYVYEYIKELICFVYDPYKKTKDKNNFEQLNGVQIIKGKTFNITVILAH